MSRRPIVLVALLFGAATLALADRGGYTIRDFRVELEVRADASLVVEERLEVRFSEPRHGIYRMIPVRYTDPRGYGYSLGFTLIEVVDDRGRRHRTKLSHQGRYVKLRIGSPDATVTGDQTYVLRYRIRDALGHFAEHDELYWNATGHEWQAPIERASARVRLPGAVAEGDMERVGYVGRYGSRARAVTATRDDEASVTFVADQPLAPLEGLTIVVAWPHGLVRFPGPAARVARFFADNWIGLAPLVALGLLVYFWRRVGRDPAGAGSIVVRYEAPPGVTPGELGTIFDEKVDLRDVTATVVDLAVRGYLRIEVERESQLFGLIDREQTVFVRLKAPDAELLDHERQILQGLFATGDRATTEDLEQRFYKRLPAIRAALYARTVEQGYFAARPSAVRWTWIAIGVAAGLATLLVGATWSSLRGGVMPQALLVPALSAILTAVLCFGFARAMPRRTRKGVELKEWALGFEEFIDRVERERLAFDRRREVFETLLPHAMALGVAAAWARRFEGIYQAAAPAWYAGSDLTGRGFSTRGFERSLASSMGRVGTAMAAAPRSQGASGSGGGGFSGGGGGGGGGGSW